MASTPAAPPAPPPAPLAEALFESCADLASACLAHPFVAGLADGSTPLRAFTAYVAQDAFFLRGFARAYGLAHDKAPPADAASRSALRGFIAGVEDELRLHAGYAASLGIDLAAAGAAPLPAAVAYVDFLLGVAGDPAAGVADVLAAMAPCMRLYAYLGCRLAGVAAAVAGAGAGASGGGDGNPAAPDAPAAHYRRWIDSYSDPGFVGLAGAVEALMEEHAARGGAGAPARLAPLYRRAFELEFAFFDAFRWDAGGEGGRVPVAPLAATGGGVAPDRKSVV